MLKNLQKEFNDLVDLACKIDGDAGGGQGAVGQDGGDQGAVGQGGGDQGAVGQEGDGQGGGGQGDGGQGAVGQGGQGAVGQGGDGQGGSQDEDKWQKVSCKQLSTPNTIINNQKIAAFGCDYPRRMPNIDNDKKKINIKINSAIAAEKINKKLFLNDGDLSVLTAKEKESLKVHNYDNFRAFDQVCCKSTADGFAPKLDDKGNEIDGTGRVNDQCLEDTYQHTSSDQRGNTKHS